jgi:hypothetical protein
MICSLARLAALKLSLWAGEKYLLPGAAGLQPRHTADSLTSEQVEVVLELRGEQTLALE